MSGLIAFDLGLTFGWFDGKVGGSVFIGKEKRMFNFYKTVLDMILKINKEGQRIDVIAFEDAKFQQGNAIYNFNGQKAILELISDSLNIKLVPVPVGTVKKYITGSGKAEKEQMISSVEAMGYEVKDSNHADAIGVYFTYKNLIKA